MRGTSDGKMVARKLADPKPTFTVSASDLPPIKNWKVGKKYKLEMEVEMVSLDKGDIYDFPSGEKESPKLRGRFKMISVSEDEE